MNAEKLKAIIATQAGIALPSIQIKLNEDVDERDIPSLVIHMTSEEVDRGMPNHTEVSTQLILLVEDDDTGMEDDVTAWLDTCPDFSNAGLTTFQTYYEGVTYDKLDKHIHQYTFELNSFCFAETV
tara:strand:+ start:1061 stop:1438 length:378 start_codon:yes stop_codon:yes gene_type:complete